MPDLAGILLMIWIKKIYFLNKFHAEQFVFRIITKSANLCCQLNKQFLIYYVNDVLNSNTDLNILRLK